MDTLRRTKTATGLIVILVGVVLIIYGIYKAFGFPFEANKVPDIVSQGFFYILVGGVLFIEGIVIQGFRKVYALILHLAAVFPYYLAIQEIVRVGNSAQTQAQAYLTASQYYFAAGVILNILGIVANHVKREPKITKITEITK